MGWKGWVILILSIWLIIASFIPGIVGSKGANLADFLIVGLIVLILGALMIKTSKIGGWIELLVGIWLVISAFIPGITGSKAGAMVNGLIFGIIALIFAFFDKKSA
jgi:hypothetical protein